MPEPIRVGPQTPPHHRAYHRGVTNLEGCAVVAVNYGSTLLLRANLAPLSDAHPELQVVVVDNFSTDAERLALRDLARDASWTLVEQPNDGFGSGCNSGVAAAFSKGAAAVVLLNPDARIDAGSVATLARAATSGEPALVAPVIRRPDGRVWFDGADVYLADGATRASRKRPAGARTWPWLTGACLAFTKRTWQLIGGFDDAYFLYWEDVDVSRRALVAGVGLRVEAQAKVIHDPGGTQADAGGGKSTAYFYYNTRNRLIFGARHLEDADYRAWVRTSPRLAVEILLRVGKRALLRSPGSAWAAFRGTLAGLREGRRIRRHPRELRTGRRAG